MTKQKHKRLEIILYIILLLIAAIRLFYRLGASSIMGVDECWYGTNTVEMFQSGNWLVPTLRHEIDYGSKPPLSLWINLICYSIFGVNTFSLRFSSALFGLIIIILISLYLWKHYSLQTAIIATAVFSTLRPCFDFHMFRSGDMDSLFCLIYIISIYALIKIYEGNSPMTILYAACIGLGFLTKSMHAAFFFIVGVLYLPMIYKKIKIRDLLLGIFAAITPTAIWLALRYQVDGFKFINAIAFGEVGKKVASSMTFEYIHSILIEKVTWLLFLILLLKIATYFFNSMGSLSVKGVFADLFSYCKKRYLSILAYLVPIILYTLSGTFYPWYVYPSFVVSVWIIAIETNDIIQCINKTALKNLLAYSVILLCTVYSVAQLPEYKLQGSGSHVDWFRDDISDCLSQLNGEYDGSRVYIAYDYGKDGADRDYWELEFVYYAESMARWECKSGGVEGFLNDEDSLLILESSLWEEYADQLTGYVFLENSTFFVLNHDRYY